MSLKIEQQKKTPRISFDKTKGKFEIEGAILPENSIKFFAPLTEYVENYLKDPLPTTTLDLYIIYFNTASSKQVYELIKLFYSAKANTNISVNWLYDEDDEDMEETGKEYDAFFQEMPFNFLPQE